MDATRAHALGLVNQLTDPGDAVAGALELASRICANAPLSVRASLSAVNEFIGADDENGWERTAAALEMITGREDTQEGISAFLEKRAPRWTGR
jgi:enoyl-CoA hydratase/carnithine racemase